MHIAVKNTILNIIAYFCSKTFSMKTTLKVISFFIILSFASCKKSTSITEEEGFDYGRVRNGKYSNTFFDIELSVPKDWNIQNKEQRNAILKEGAELITEDNEAYKEALIKSAEINSANLLTVYKHNPNNQTIEEYNTNFMLIAENIKAGNIKSGAEYLIHAKKVLEATTMDFTYTDDTFTERDINGIQFYSMNIKINYMGIPIHQSYLATVKNGFALGFIYSYIDNAQKDYIENNVIKTIKYTK